MLEGLNPRQREAVVHPDGPLLVIAGAGSGKTRVLTTRIAWLIREQGELPDSILAFTFTNKAAREMRERVLRLAPESERRCWIGTFHATGVRILRREAPRIGYPRDFTIYDADDGRALIKRILIDAKADPKQFSPRGVQAEISRHKNEFRRPEHVASRALTPRDEKLAQFYASYDQALRKNGAMDFDDLIARTVDLFEEHRDVQTSYSQRFHHVLVDEFQDTNPLQLVMIRALSAEHDNLCAVGDDDQSIYSWRGATVENMLGFEEYFPGAAIVRLEQNYRSTSLILHAANGVISHNRRRKGKTLWSERSGGDPIEMWWAQDEEDEAIQVRDRIATLLAESDATRGEMVVLYRTNAQSRALEDALRREGIPYQIVGGTRFYERREVRDLLAYLKVLQNAQDTVSFARILNVPKRGIGKTSAERFFGALPRHGGNALALCLERSALIEACGVPAAKRLLQFGRLLEDLRRLTEGSDAAVVLRQLIKSVNYEKYLETDDPASAQERLENVSELVNAAEEFVSESDEPKLSAFLESVALLADVDRLAEETELVTLMTMHNAKGLEFPYVFVAGCEEGLLPHASSSDEDDAVEEERRLFYVALTRAEQRIFLHAASARRRFGSYEGCAPSRFLRELPDDTVVEMSEQPSPGASFGLHSASGTSQSLSRSRRVSEGISVDNTSAVEAFRRSRARQRARRSQAEHDFESHHFNQEEVSFRVGSRVRHDLLGDGVVEELEGSGDLLRLTVRFGDIGRKRILARYAHLTLLEEG